MTTTTIFTPALSGATFGFDFCPPADRIRVISNTRQNIRLNPETGAVVGADTDLTPGTPAVAAAAYNNNTVGNLSIVLYVIDPSTDKLYTVGNPSPNTGVLTEVGALGINVDATTTGAATAVGDFTGPVKGLAVTPGL